MTDDKQVRFGAQMSELILAPDGVTMSGHIGAKRIIANPQAHIDALVEAGVLKDWGAGHGGNHIYVVVQPHKHEWTVSYVNPGEPATVLCPECGRFDSVPNRLPIEVPE